MALFISPPVVAAAILVCPLSLSRFSFLCVALVIIRNMANINSMVEEKGQLEDQRVQLPNTLIYYEQISSLSPEILISFFSGTMDPFLVPNRLEEVIQHPSLERCIN